MSLLTKLNRALGFTPTESKVILFLVVAFLAGMVIRLYKISHQAPLPSFQYAQMDSEFSARSRLANDSSSADDDTASMGNSFIEKQSDVRLKININTATKIELMKLPGIGPALADRIIRHRTEYGPFSSTDQLMKVSGIGKKKFDRIALYCTIER